MKIKNCCTSNKNSCCKKCKILIFACNNDIIKKGIVCNSRGDKKKQAVRNYKNSYIKQTCFKNMHCHKSKNCIFCICIVCIFYFLKLANF